MDTTDTTFAALTADLDETFASYESYFASIEAAPVKATVIEAGTRVTFKKSGQIYPGVVLELGEARGLHLALVLLDNGQKVATDMSRLRIAA